MGQLVDTDRDIVGPVDDYVGGLKKGVTQEAVGRQILVGHLLSDLLVGGNSLQPGQRGDHGKENEELRVLQDGRLEEQGGPFSVETHAQPILDDLLRILGQGGRFVVHGGQGVPVCHEIEALVLLLEADPVAEGSEVMPDVKGPCGPHAG